MPGSVLLTIWTLVVNFPEIWARAARHTRFGSCIAPDRAAATLPIVAFPSRGPQTGACDVCGAEAVAAARAAARRGCGDDVPGQARASAAGAGARQARRVAVG